MPKIQHCWDRPVYWEDFWRFEETSFYSNSSRKPSAYAGVKSSHGVQQQQQQQ